MTQHAQIGPGRTCLFDLDGVLIDSSASAARHWGMFAAEYGLDPDGVIARIPGRRAIDSVRELIPDAPETEIVAAAAAQEQAALTDHDGVIALPGARVLLSALGTCGWAVVTSSPRELATVRLQIAGLPHPPLLIAAEDVGAGKPDPEPYLTAAAKLGADAERCIVFEDAPAGIRAARAAGMQVIALTTTHPAFELPGGAELTVPNLASVTVGPCARHDVGGTDGRDVAGRRGQPRGARGGGPAVRCHPGTPAVLDGRSLSGPSSHTAASGLVIVAIDATTFNYVRDAGMRSQFPFPRRYYARVLDHLHKAGARVIVVDIQFTEATDANDDNALYDAVGPGRDFRR